MGLFGRAYHRLRHAPNYAELQLLSISSHSRLNKLGSVLTMRWQLELSMRLTWAPRLLVADTMLGSSEAVGCRRAGPKFEVGVSTSEHINTMMFRTVKSSYSNSPCAGTSRGTRWQMSLLTWGRHYTPALIRSS